jgi:pyruvate, orthophosphate dikinase
MMDSILNVGINDEIVRRLAQVTGNQRFALNVQMKFLFLWGTVVLGLPKENFIESITRIMKEENVTREFWLCPLGLQKVIMEFKKLGDAPQDPFEQLQRAIESIFRSWQCPRCIGSDLFHFTFQRAAKYRSLHNISESIGTAVIVQVYSFMNLNDNQHRVWFMEI